MSEISSDEYRPAGVWERSSACDSGGCVEVQTHLDIVIVRSSKTPHMFVTFTVAEWRAFIAGVERGEFHV